MLARVSSIETFRRWRLDEEQDAADLIARLTDFQPTEAMEAGTAFHKALELAEHFSFLLEGAVARAGLEGTPARLEHARAIASRMLAAL